MKRFEYKVKHLTIPFEKLEEEQNKLGVLGWNIYQVDNKEPGTYILYCKKDKLN